MALNDVRVREWGSGSIRQIPTEAAATDILVGEPVKMKADGSPYAIPLATGDPEIGTDQFLGIAMSASSHTATADGVVSVFQPGTDSVLECKATTVANVDTKAEIDALINDTVTFDLTGSTYTIDEDEGNDDNVHGLRIIGGNASTQVLYVKVKPKAMDTDSEIA
jgi:hypothetical protein